jgi:nucleotide-binding universal stress UspA family protein
MTHKSILAVASGGEGDLLLFNVAAGLAKRADGRVKVVPAFPDIAAAYAAFGVALRRGVQADVTEQIQASERAELERVARRAQEAALRLGGAPFEVEPRALSPGQALALSAVLADLVVFAGAAARGELMNLFAETLLSGRAPILVANRDANMEKVAVAWDASAQAGRAVRAALPFLAAAKSVVILTNTDDAGAEENAARVQRLLDYLALHGVRQAAAQAVRGDNVAASLLTATAAAGCGLLVCGAYGRPRFSELVLGGTTRALLKAEAAPNLLLAH